MDVCSSTKASQDVNQYVNEYLCRPYNPFFVDDPKYTGKIGASTTRLPPSSSTEDTSPSDSDSSVPSRSTIATPSPTFFPDSPTSTDISGEDPFSEIEGSGGSTSGAEGSKPSNAASIPIASLVTIPEAVAGIIAVVAAFLW